MLIAAVDPCEGTARWREDEAALFGASTESEAMDVVDTALDTRTSSDAVDMRDRFGLRDKHRLLEAGSCCSVEKASEKMRLLIAVMVMGDVAVAVARAILGAENAS